jgi:hypothetical protein
MATVGARLQNDGTLLTAGTTPGDLDTGFDEVTQSSHSVTVENIFSYEFDEVTLDGGAPSGGSIVLNGTSQYLTTAGSGDFQFGTEDFTVEGWFYSTSNNFQRLWCFPDGDNVEIMNGQVYYWKGSGLPIGSGSDTFYLNRWMHIALVKKTTVGINSGNPVATVYVNGVSMIVDNSPYNSASSRSLAIGGEITVSIPGQDATLGTVDGYFTGNITNFRIVKGLAVYTGNFSTRIAPFTATQEASVNISSITGSVTKLLLNMVDSGTLVTDSSGTNKSVTNQGSATFSALTPLSSNYNGAMKQRKSGELLVKNEFDEYTGIV